MTEPAQLAGGSAPYPSSGSQATARRAGIAYGTAREYLERIKRKYTDAGRPTRTKMDLIERAREDRLESRGLNGGGSS